MNDTINYLKKDIKRLKEEACKVIPIETKQFLLHQIQVKEARLKEISK